MKGIETEMTYPIYVYGHPVLRKVAQEIDRNYPDLDRFIADMFETMYKSDGLGLAAPQVGKSIRLFVIDGEPLAEDHPEMKDFRMAFINPLVVERKGTKVPLQCFFIKGNLRRKHQVQLIGNGYSKWNERTHICDLRLLISLK